VFYFFSIHIIYMSNKKDKKEIPKVLLELIEAFSEFSDLKGREKREKVLEKMMIYFDIDTEMVLILGDFIDLIVDVSKNKHKIKKNAKKIFSLCC